MVKFKKLHIKADTEMVKCMRTKRIAIDDARNGNVSMEVTEKPTIACYIYKFGKKDTAALLDLIPEELKQLEVPVVTFNIFDAQDFGESVVRWHTDWGRKTAINWYIESNNDVTKYLDCEFTADEGEFFLLDVSQPHSVDLNDGKRAFVSYSYLQHNLQEILESAGETQWK